MVAAGMAWDIIDTMMQVATMVCVDMLLYRLMALLHRSN
jgi:hypothetical protein